MQDVDVANSEVSIDGDVVHKSYLRTDRGRPEREWTALTLLQQQTSMLAPSPIARETEPPVTTMSRVMGAPLDDVLTPWQTSQMVSAYRSLYAVTMPPELPLRYLHPAAFIAESVRRLADTSHDDHPDVVRHALQAVSGWYDHAPPGISEIRDPVLAQADGNVANMLWDGERVWLVDFEYAGVGDLAFEVADLVEHVSSRLRGWLDPEAVIAGFDLTEAQLTRVEAYRAALAGFWLLMLLPGSPGHDLNPPGSAERQARHLLSRLAR